MWGFRSPLEADFLDLLFVLGCAVLAEPPLDSERGKFPVPPRDSERCLVSALCFLESASVN